MPRGRWTVKDERKYKHILKSCRTGRKKRALKVCQRIAAATVNRDRGLGGVRGGCSAKDLTNLTHLQAVVVHHVSAGHRKLASAAIKRRDALKKKLVACMRR